MVTSRPFFSSGPNFLDPQTSKDGKPYGPKHYKDLVKQCWYISDQLHTSYTDILDLSVTERVMLLGFINEKLEDTQEALDKIAAENNSRY